MSIEVMTPLPEKVAPAEPAPSATPLQIGELFCYNYAVGGSTLGKSIAVALEDNPKLPGVLVMDRDPDGNPALAGMISRQKFFERLGRPFGVEIFLNRPIIQMVEQLNLPPLRLSHKAYIDETVQLALNRPLSQLYDPVVVEFDAAACKLLDFHMLLLAQSQLLADANRLIQAQAQVGQALSSTLDSARLYPQVLASLGEITRFDWAAVLIENGAYLEVVAQQGKIARSRPLTHIPIASNQAYRQLRIAKEPLMWNDDSPERQPRMLEPIHGARSWLALSLNHSNQMIGAVMLARNDSQPFADNEVALAQALSLQAAVAIQNARLYDEVRRFNQDLEGVIRERTETLRKTHAELERLDRTKTNFIDIITRELQMPLTMISGHVDILSSDMGFQRNRSHALMVFNIRNGVKRLNDVITSMTELVQIENRQLVLKPTPLDITALLQDLRNEWLPLANERRIVLRLEPATACPPIHGDAAQLNKALRQLVTNALKFTPDGGEISIQARWLPQGHRRLERECVEISVRDTGVGIAKENQDAIFTKFFQTGEVTLSSENRVRYLSGGSGLGLTISRGIVEAHGGQIWVESPGNDPVRFPGSKFYILLPSNPQTPESSASPATG